MIEVIERLADGTLLLSNGFRIMPSRVTGSDGSERRLSDMTTEERREWNARAMERLGKSMSAMRYGVTA